MRAFSIWGLILCFRRRLPGSVSCRQQSTFWGRRALRASPCVVTVQEAVLTPSAPFGWKRFSSHLCTAVIDVAVTLGPLLMLEAFDARPGHHFFCFAVLAGVGAAHWEAGVMEADVLPSADKRYVHKEDEKHFLKVFQHAAIFGHPSHGGQPTGSTRW